MGRTEPIVSRLQTEMDKASQSLNFEKAALIRDRFRRSRVWSKNKRSSQVNTSIRSHGLWHARMVKPACRYFLSAAETYRRDYFLLEAQPTPRLKCVRIFHQTILRQSPNVPPQLVLPMRRRSHIIRQWLSQKSHGPQSGNRCSKARATARPGQMAAENAIETLNSLKAQWQADKNRPVWKPLASCNLYSIFLVRSPHRMLSISNTQGTSAVAVGGIRTRHTQKQYYRHFNIRQVSGPDDFASMEEVLTRVSIAG